jgi:hypothetical protein
MVAKNRTCPVCGEGKIAPVAEPGRIAEHHNVRLEIPADVEIPTCNNCGEQFFNEATARLVDARLDQVLEERLHAVFVAALEEIERLTTRGKLEKLLDWSPGYISKMITRRKKVEHRTAVLFELIAEDPGRLKRAIDAIERHTRPHPGPPTELC